MRKTLKCIFMLCIVLLIVNSISYAGYSFSEVDFDIDSIEIDDEIFKKEDTGKQWLEILLTKGIGFNNVYVPYLLIIIYIIIELILIKKYKKVKPCILINLEIILTILITNNIIENFVIDKSSEVIYITSTMYVTNSFMVEKIVNIVINSLLLIIGLIYQIRILKKYEEEQLEKKYKKIKLIIPLQIIIIVALVILINIGPKMHIVEVDWSFGYDFEKRAYDTKIIEGEDIGNTNFKVLEIDDEGVLIEYNRGYYESNSKDDEFSIMNMEYTYKTETVQQKMIWNTNYSYHVAEDPMLCVDGGTHYYVRFEK